MVEITVPGVSAMIIFNIGMGGLFSHIFTSGNILYSLGWTLIAFFGNLALIHLTKEKKK